jgi:hypothetical protein
MNAAEHASLLEVLSERLLEDFSQEVWRKAFLGPGCEWIRFGRENVTFVATGESLASEWMPDEIEALAARHGGRVELTARRPVLVFRDERAAHQVARLLQRTCGNRLRIALVTARCTTAAFDLDGEPRRLTVGGGAAAAVKAAERCAVGAIQVFARRAEAQAASCTASPQGDMISVQPMFRWPSRSTPAGHANA